MSAKESKGRFLKPDKLQNHTNEGKKKKKKGKRDSEEEERRRREKAMVTLLVFILATLKIAFGQKKKINGWTKKKKSVHLAITLSKIRLEDYME